MQANARDEEDQTLDSATTSEEGAESPIAGRRDKFLTAHRLDLHPSRHADAESPTDIEEFRGIAHIAAAAAAAHYAGQSSTESTNGDDAEFIGGTTAIVPDETTLASAANQPATEHIRDLLDTPATLASRIARQNDESVDSYRTSTFHPEDRRRGI